MSTQNKKRFFGLGILIAVSSLLIHAFIPSESPVEYLNRVDNSFGTYVQSKEFGDLRIDMTYKSSSYLAAAQLVKSSTEKEFSYKDLKKEFSNSSNYSLRLENTKGRTLVKEIASDSEGYQELIHYFSFGIQEDLFLCTPSDTLKCNFVHFERNYDLAPYTNIELGFNIKNLHPKLEDQKEWSVLFNADRLGLGPLYFRYESSTVNEHPNFTF